MYFHCYIVSRDRRDGVQETDIITDAACTKGGIEHKEEGSANIEAARRHQTSHHIIPRRIKSLPSESIGAKSIVGEALHWVLQSIKTISNSNEKCFSCWSNFIGVIAIRKVAECSLHCGIVR